MSKIQSEDLILINRDGVDYQAKVSDLPGGGGGGSGGGGGGGLDDILAAPVVKGPMYHPHHFRGGEWLPMDLVDGDGKSGSTFNAPGFQYLTGGIQYKNSTNSSVTTSEVCIAQFANLSVAVDDIQDDDATGRQVFVYELPGSMFHVRGNQRAKIKIKVDFTDCNGDAAHLFITCQNYVYRSMRREDIDLREMEALDKELKNKKSKKS